MVQLLLRKGALIEVMARDNNTPLHLAVQNGHTSTVKLLLQEGASTEGTMSKYGYTPSPLHYAIQHLHLHTDIVELPLERGALTEATDEYNNTPLHLAARECLLFDGGATSQERCLDSSYK